MDEPFINRSEPAFTDEVTRIREAVGDEPELIKSKHMQV